MPDPASDDGSALGSPRILRAGAAAALLVASLYGLALSGCEGSTAPAEPRLVVLYATCTLSREFLSPYDSGVSFTPEIDRFADESVVFMRHQSEAGQSGIAYASIFSGTQADRHHIFHHPRRLGDGAYLIGEAFADAGWSTFFWSGHGMAGAGLNYAQGVPTERITTVPKSAEGFAVGVQMDFAAGDESFEQVLRELRRDPEARALAVLNFSVTHNPYGYGAMRPEGFLDRFIAEFPELAEGLTTEEIERYYALYSPGPDLFRWKWDFPRMAEEAKLSPEDTLQMAKVIHLVYAANVRLLDSLFGMFTDKIRAAGLIDESIIALTADHGEVMYRENALYKWTHGLQLAPEVLGVPWLLRGGEAVAPRIYEGVTRSIDIFPTVAGLAGVPIPEGAVDGADLSAVLVAGAPEAKLRAFSHTAVPLGNNAHGTPHEVLRTRFFPSIDPNHMWVQVRDGDIVQKYRNLDGTNWGSERFDMSIDPIQAQNRFDAAELAHAEVERELKRYKSKLVEQYYVRETTNTGRALSLEEEERRLRSLGYIR